MIELPENSLGNFLEAKFLTSLIPPKWKEEVYENTKFYSIKVNGERLSDDDWTSMTNLFRREFGENLIKINSIISNGSHFVIYLKKDL